MAARYRMTALLLVVGSTLALPAVRGDSAQPSNDLAALVDPLIGSYIYTLRRIEGTLKIAARKAVLDLEALRPHGTLSIIL